MSISKEQEVLLQFVKRWFNRPDQISHYLTEVSDGPTKAERYLLNNLFENGTILDVGCGAGRISMFLAEKGYKVIGVDVSESLIIKAREISKKKDLDINFIVTKGIELPFDGETYDFIVGFKFLCYIPTSQLRHDYLKNLYRILRPGGILLITQNIVPEEYIDEARDEYFQGCSASHFTSLEQGDNFPLGDGYVHWFTEKQLLDELSNTEFLIEQFDTDEAHAGDGLLRLVKLRKD
ncbi:class I SAM-dependent methyltransferase [Paenibacillus camelliae]|uniref:class I SAM-dependent methyltransferase n=1 Tax=Paenibacillus camelliae TaxID=512410 RepID=UPI00203C18C5|nr:class I SAM-dependent methyltransferase [Paenibacillus camelliae]MCM3633536.1 class I SAM-dependent methyltransferase [Paenibacillus camelliae]